MIEKSDWDAAFQELVAETSRRPAEIPEVDDLLAFSRGELSGEEAERVQAALARYPELSQALAEPFPYPYQPRPGDPRLLTREQENKDWAKLQARLAASRQPIPAPPPLKVVPAAKVVFPPPRPRPPQRIWQFSTTAAAVAAVILGGFAFQMWTQIRRFTREPRILENRILLPDGVRGGDQPAIFLPSKPDAFLLTPSLIDPSEYPEYRLDILQGSGNEAKRIWSTTGLPRRPSGTFEIWVPRAFLKSGQYQLQIHGLDAEQSKLLATYTIQLPD